MDSRSRALTNRSLVFLLLFAGVGLLSGLYVGFVRLGFLKPTSQPISLLAHGPLMINGFLGTLISLERTAALGKKWVYEAPIFLATGTILLLFGVVGLLSEIFFVVGAAIFLLTMIYLYRVQPEIYHLIMLLGVLSLLVGNILLLLNFPIFKLVGWWIGFPLLTILGERLELNRVMRPPKKAQFAFLGFNLLWIVGIIITFFMRNTGWRISSIFLIIMAAWLIRYDVARRTIKAFSWTRYSATCLLTGYGWLIIAGLFGLGYGFPIAGFLYDAQLHIIFVGFVFSMIFAHSSVIIPALSDKDVPYHSYFYLPLVLLHGFLIVRVVGDIAGLEIVRSIGGYGNVLAILMFLGGIIIQLVREFFNKKARIAKSVNQPINHYE